MRWPDFGFGRIEGDNFCVGYVVAKLRSLSAMNRLRRQIQTANAEFRTSELLDGFAVVFTSFLYSLFEGAAFELAIGLVARDQHVGDIGHHRQNHDRGVEVRIL